MGIPSARIDIGGKACYCYDSNNGAADAPFLIQPADDHDLAVLDSEVAEIGRLLAEQAGGAPARATADAACGGAFATEGARGFRLVAFKVDDWNADLSPWEAPPAFGNEPFVGKAEETLAYIENELLPALQKGIHVGSDGAAGDGASGGDGAAASDALASGAPVILGGYSLAGLFALWAGTRSERFSGIAAASPSVWFPGWTEYAEKFWLNEPKGAEGSDSAESNSLKSGPQRIYLSLGNKEEKTRNQQMARVGDCIRRQQEILEAAVVANTLVWEQGNHFKEPDLRTARAFAWVLGGLRAEAK